MTTLCLACSSSLPPKSTQPIFTTPCCSRPICPQCISANPRLARYNPCLACLGGVGVVNAGASTSSVQQLNAPTSRNVDGAVRDEDTFVLGDDEDDDQEPTDPQPPATAPVESSPETPATPSKYYIKRGDTLQGIALRFGLDASGRALCRLNNLPPSTLSTTPHILHTRAFLSLPPSAHAKLQASDITPPDGSAEEQRAREVSRTRERAGKRLQTLTKEVDWRVARAYVALADDPDEAAVFARKQKELGAPAAAPLDAVAVDHYLEDLEWEADTCVLSAAT